MSKVESNNNSFIEEDLIDNLEDDDLENDLLKDDEIIGSYEEFNKEKDQKGRDLSGTAVKQRFYQIMNDYHSNDSTKREQAIERAMKELEGFIHYIIKRSYSTYTKEYYRDLLQEGYLGVLVGLEKYNPDLSMPSTFFFPYIKHEMQSFITKHVDKTTSHYSSNIKKINKVIDSFEEEGKNYTSVDIAIQTGMTVETIERSMKIRHFRDEIHIEGMAGDGLEDKVNSDFKTPENAFIQKEENESLYNTIDRLLTENEIKVLQMKYGINDSETFPEGEIAKKLCIPKDRVKSLQNSAIRKLRNSNLDKMFKDNLKGERKLINSSNVPIAPRQAAANAMEQFENIDINF